MPDKEKYSQFVFTDLSLTQGKEIDGMAAGQFTDMWGRDTIIDKLDDYVKNTTENLEATRTESGELVGLPIDAYGHDEGDGAGWITGVRKEGDIVRFTVKWTELGEDLIKRNIRRFFSPTILLKEHVILGGSLTNWPATRTPKGKILLKPIELSESMVEAFEYQDPGLLQRIYDSLMQLVSHLKGTPPGEGESIQVEEPMPELADLTPEQIAELQSQVLAGLSSNPSAELSAIIDTEVDRRIAAKLAQAETQAHVEEFTARVLGGTKEQPIGLPVTKESLTEFLLSLSPEQRKTAEDILEAVFTKEPIPFQEVGHNKVLSGHAQLPDWAKTLLSEWLAQGLSMDSFFSANSTELGNMQDYDLQEFKEKE